MMHVKFYAISILFLVVVGTCFILIAMGHGTDQGIAADNLPNSDLNDAQMIPDRHAVEGIQTVGVTNTNTEPATEKSRE